jgi:hypothetical protein
MRKLRLSPSLPNSTHFPLSEKKSEPGFVSFPTDFVGLAKLRIFSDQYFGALGAVVDVQPSFPLQPVSLRAC